MFMKSVTAAFETCWGGDRADLNTQLRQSEAAYFGLEAFMGKSDREKIWINYQEFRTFCEIVMISQPTTDADVEEAEKQFAKFQNSFRSDLHQALF